MSDETQYRRAREVLEGAGWLFDAFVAAEQRAWLASAAMDHDRREHHYHRAHIASEMRALLESLVEAYEADLKIEKRKSQMKESRDGR